MKWKGALLFVRVETCASGFFFRFAVYGCNIWAKDATEHGKMKRPYVYARLQRGIVGGLVFYFCCRADILSEVVDAHHHFALFSFPAASSRQQRSQK